jgi:hypothetical protein
MSRLMQAGTSIPDGDRRGVYNHLERHYRQFEKEAPEFRSLSEVEALGELEVRGLFLEGEAEMLPEEFARIGAVLNVRNRERLEQAVTLIRSVLESADKPKEDAETEGHGDAETAEEDTDRTLTEILTRLRA